MECLALFLELYMDFVKVVRGKFVTLLLKNQVLRFYITMLGISSD